MTKKTEASELTAEELESVQGGNGPTLEKKSLFDARFPYVDPSKQGYTGSSEPAGQVGRTRWIEGNYLFDESY